MLKMLHWYQRIWKIWLIHQWRFFFTQRYDVHDPTPFHVQWTSGIKSIHVLQLYVHCIIWSSFLSHQTPQPPSRTGIPFSLDLMTIMNWIMSWIKVHSKHISHSLPFSFVPVRHITGSQLLQVGSLSRIILNFLPTHRKHTLCWSRNNCLVRNRHK